MTEGREREAVSLEGGATGRGGCGSEEDAMVSTSASSGR